MSEFLGPQIDLNYIFPPGCPVQAAHILVAEDDTDWKELHSLYAQGGGHTIEIVDSPEKAIEKIEGDGFGFAVIDGFGGKCFNVYDAAKAKGIPAVIITASKTIVDNAPYLGYQAIRKRDSQKIKELYKRIK